MDSASSVISCLRGCGAEAQKQKQMSPWEQTAVPALRVSGTQQRAGASAAAVRTRRFFSRHRRTHGTGSQRAGSGVGANSAATVSAGASHGGSQSSPPPTVALSRSLAKPKTTRLAKTTSLSSHLGTLSDQLEDENYRCGGGTKQSGSQYGRSKNSSSSSFSSGSKDFSEDHGVVRAEDARLKDVLQDVVCNGHIWHGTLRVVSKDGHLLGNYDREEALELAREKNTDLVLLDALCEPPLARLIDLGEYLRQKQRKLEANVTKGGRVGEIEGFKFDPSKRVRGMQFSAVIDARQFRRKLETVRFFLTSGHRVQCQLSFSPTSDERNYRDPNETNPIPEKHRTFEREYRGNKQDGWVLMMELARRILGEVRDLAKLGPDLPCPEAVQVSRVTGFLNLWPCSTMGKEFSKKTFDGYETKSEEELLALLQRNMVWADGRGQKRQWVKRVRVREELNRSGGRGYAKERLGSVLTGEGYCSRRRGGGHRVVRRDEDA
eukprot:g7543.t1